MALKLYPPLSFWNNIPNYNNKVNFCVHFPIMLKNQMWFDIKKKTLVSICNKMNGVQFVK